MANNTNSIKDGLLTKINPSAAELNKYKNILRNLDLDNAVYHVTVYASDASHMVKTNYHGSLQDVVMSAELEYIENNPIGVQKPELFTVHLCVNKNMYIIPETSWNQYRTLL